MSATAEAVRERPILFSSEMVKAILEGRKTQTRRIVKPQPPTDFPFSVCDRFGLCGWHDGDGEEGNWWPPDSVMACPYGRPGDRLWVRTSFWDWTGNSGNYQIWDEHTKCVRFPDGRMIEDCKPNHENGHLWRKRPSIHMPRWASRITLEIVKVRVERLQEISEEDAIAEGIASHTLSLTSPTEVHKVAGTCRRDFAVLWDSINGKKHPWTSNPWCWVLEFRRLDSGGSRSKSYLWEK